MSDIKVKKSRSVLVTGGNRGIGLAIAKEFLRQGDKVAITCRSGEVPEGVLGVSADVTDMNSLREAFQIIDDVNGPVEVLVANAGITKDNLLLRMAEADFQEVIDVNLVGSFRVVKQALKGMMKSRFGRIVFISSTVGMLGSAGQVNYAASKSGLVGMARSITRELGGRGITANVVAPGFIETDMTRDLSEELKKKYLDNIPVGRFAAPEEVASAVVWLCGEDAGYISGALIPVDGGVGMGH